jgi:hypothetical protein
MTTEAVTVEERTLKGTVSFTRKISDGNYGGSEFFMAVQFDIDPTAGGEAVIASARAAAVQAKAVVFEQLGIDHTLDESGVVVEQVRRAFPGSVVEPAPQASTPAPSAAGEVGSEPPFPANTTDADQKKANKDWATSRYASNPSEFYDNRPKKASGEYKQNSPDLKHKGSGIGIWLS